MSARATTVSSLLPVLAATVLLAAGCATAPPPSPAGPGTQAGTGPGGEDTADEAAWEEDDRADELSQLLAQAEANLQGASGLDDVRREEIARWAEELRSALEREAALLESGAAQDEIATAGGDVSAAAEALRAALAAVADAASFDDQWNDGPEPYDGGGGRGAGTPFLDRVVGTLDSALAALDRIHQIRASLRGFSRDEDAVPDAPGWNDSWPADSYEDVSGVVTMGGEPVTGARVFEPALGLEAITDASGAYRLALPPRASRLLVSKAGRQMAEAVVHVRRGRGALADFEVRGGRQAAARARILASDVAVRRQGAGPTGTIRAVVEDAKGRTLARTLVRLDGQAAARTDGAGRCVFRGVPPGQHRLNVAGSEARSVEVQPSRVAEATLAVNAPLARAVRPAPPGPGRRHAAARPPQPSPRPSPRPDARPSGRPAPTPSRSGEIHGRVMSDGRPVSGAAVTVEGSSRSARTDRDGSYSITLQEGKYRVRAGKAGFEPEERSVHVGGGKRAGLSFDLRARERERPAGPERRKGAASPEPKPKPPKKDKKGRTR